VSSDNQIEKAPNAITMGKTQISHVHLRDSRLKGIDEQEVAQETKSITILRDGMDRVQGKSTAEMSDVMSTFTVLPKSGNILIPAPQSTDCGSSKTAPIVQARRTDDSRPSLLRRLSRRLTNANRVTGTASATSSRAENQALNREGAELTQTIQDLNRGPSPSGPVLSTNANTNHKVASFVSQKCSRLTAADPDTIQRILDLPAHD
jgi:hypothetical protein